MKNFNTTEEIKRKKVLRKYEIFLKLVLGVGNIKWREAFSIL